MGLDRNQDQVRAGAWTGSGPDPGPGRSPRTAISGEVLRWLGAGLVMGCSSYSGWVLVLWWLGKSPRQSEGLPRDPVPYNVFFSICGVFVFVVVLMKS